MYPCIPSSSIVTRPLSWRIPTPHFLRQSQQLLHSNLYTTATASCQQHRSIEHFYISKPSSGSLFRKTYVVAVFVTSNWQSSGASKGTRQAITSSGAQGIIPSRPLFIAK